MKCEECEADVSEVCIECEEKLCSNCSVKLHSGGKRRYHERRKICISCNCISSVFCNNCKFNLCKKCELNHLTHETMTHPKTIIYWDVAYVPESIQMPLVYYIIQMQPKIVKTYSKYLTPRVHFGNNVSFSHRPCHFSTTFFSDLYNDISYGLTDCYIISELTPCIYSLVNSNITMLNFYHINPNTLSPSPLGSSYLLRSLYKHFFKGKILLNFHIFLKKCCEKWGKELKELKEQLSHLQSCGKICLITKEFNQFKLQQISLVIKELNPKVCLSILRSLRIDEIFPSEKAIQSRIREAFSHKLTSTEWTLLIKTMQNARIEPNFTLFSQTQSEAQFHFQQILYEEERTFAIYPKGEEWASSDQFGDVQTIKETQEWKGLVEFLSNFFNSDEKSVTLTGGKYGCALLLKNFASDSIKSLSIGKLSFMVQIAINDDIIRYQKTLLIWAQSQQIKCPDVAINERVGIIHKEIVKLLKTKPTGLPLAQIPICLKRRLKFQLNLNELGFKKLKDLLNAFQDIYLYPANSKNPSAFLNIQQIKLSTLVEFVLSEIKKNTFCLTESQLSAEIQKEFGSVSWKAFMCINLIDFIDLYCKNLKILKVGNEFIFIGRESEKEELSLSTHNSEYDC